MSKAHDTEQPGSVGTSGESMMAADDSHHEAIRREASGNALTMSQLFAGGAAGQAVPDPHPSVATSRPNNTSDIESYNAVMEGKTGPRGL
ncbi:hypothetical protein PhCBS80983_g02227 [Powellomyces hirtus]|uniref:Uncharacterized protein n=1 Tax=Powellomyces hirtus TaxID=109895 RepID=A0A507E7A4_9FUNG|nr:hypothetical protein PhCBS80983_g02227 [Powellomyces hirtus]